MKKILITGGAGFIGCNAAVAFAKKGWKVFVLDNLSRDKSADNLAWLKQSISVQFIKKDIRSAPTLNALFKKHQFDAVLHAAGQVAVTDSVKDPRHDFDVNALGTFNILEAIRLHSPKTFLIYTSTNKVYGSLEHIHLKRMGKKYWPRVPALRKGVKENQPLDFHSPYGCSKGAAESYVLDYARIYDLKTVVFRQSCIYGTRQFGMEDQGWVAWFLIAALQKRTINIYGDGYQVRDVLFIDDLVALYQKAFQNKHICSGQAYNVGGGPKNTTSLMELIDVLESKLQQKIPLKFFKPRPGDQKYYVSCLEKAKKDFQWTPKVSLLQGVERMIHGFAYMRK